MLTSQWLSKNTSTDVVEKSAPRTRDRISPGRREKTTENEIVTFVYYTLSWSNKNHMKEKASKLRITQKGGQKDTGSVLMSRVFHISPQCSVIDYVDRGWSII